MQLHKDVRIITHRAASLDPSAYPFGASKEERRFPYPSGASVMLIDVTQKRAYLPVGLPKKEYMEQVIKIWEEEGLSPLRLNKPWHGYYLDHWIDGGEEVARLTVAAEYIKLGEIRLKKRKKLS